MNFGKRLSELRRLKGVTQEDVAKTINVKRSTYAGYEVKNLEPAFDILIDLADYFDCSLDFLLCRTQNPENISEIECLFEKLNGNNKIKIRERILTLLEEQK